MEQTIFFIISSNSKIFFRKDLIYLSKRKNIEIIEEDLIRIKENIINHMEIEGLDEFCNIYLYKTKIKIKNKNEKIFIKINFCNKKLKSKTPIKIKSNGSINFIYEILYEYSKTAFLPNDEIYEFLNNKYKISKLKKFMIFKRYLEIHEKSKYIDNLLERTQNEIINSTEIDYDFFLSFLITLFEEKTKDSENSKKLKPIFELAISKFNNIPKIIIKGYNNEEFNKIIKRLEEYKINLKDKNLILNLELVILLFYQTNYRTKFKSFFETINYKNDVVKYILKYKLIFNKYDCSELKLIYDNADEKEIGNISFLSSNFNEFINFICLNIENIKNKKLYKYLKFEKCPIPNENYNSQNLIKFIEFTIDEKNIDFPSKQFIDLVGKLNLKDYKKLFELKSIFIKYEKNWKVKDILKKLNESFHYTGKKFIEENKLKNLDIITFIQEDAKNYYSSYKEDESFTRLIGNINLDKIDDEAISKFIGNPYYDYHKLMEKNYKKFIYSIIKNVKSFQHLKILYKMFNLDEKQDKEIILEIINLLNKKGLEKNVSVEELSNIFGKLISYIQLIDEKNEFLRLINGIKLYFKDSEINNIFINILNNNEFKLYQDTIDRLINIITNNPGVLSNEGITILKKFSNKEIQIQFLKKQRREIIKEEELYNEIISDNLKYVFDLIKDGFLDEKFNKVPYIKNTKEFIENHLNNLKEFNFSMNLLKKMKELNTKNNLKNRLQIISLGDNSFIDDLYYSLTEKIDSCYKVYEQIKEIINIFSIYLPQEEKDTINKLKKTENEINFNPINKFPQKSIIISQFDIKFNKAEEINKLKDSKIFIEIFYKNKFNKKQDSLILNQTKKEFNNLKNLFDPQTEDNVDLKILEEIMKKIDINEITKEFELLIKIHNINQNKNKDIFEKLKLFKNKFKNLEIIHKIILFYYKILIWKAKKLKRN